MYLILENSMYRILENSMYLVLENSMYLVLENSMKKLREARRTAFCQNIQRWPVSFSFWEKKRVQLWVTEKGGL